MASWASLIPSLLATTTGRIEFIILRTDSSPSVALHLLLRERSYFQLLDSDQAQKGTCTLPIKRPRRRTRVCACTHHESHSTLPNQITSMGTSRVQTSRWVTWDSLATFVYSGACKHTPYSRSQDFQRLVALLLPVRLQFSRGLLRAGTAT